MVRLRSLLARWRRSKDVAVRDILRDPNGILLERAPDPVASREGARGN